MAEAFKVLNCSWRRFGDFLCFFVICDMFMGLANCELMYEKLANLQWEI